jgi:hypothetical protein
MELSADPSLTVALAEYAELSELRRRADQGSAARFNYFTAVAAAGAAIASALIASSDKNPAAQLAGAVAIGAMLLLLGVMSFVRLVNYRLSRAEYTAAMAALRSYFVHRAPDVGPFIVLPTGDYSVRPRRGPLAKPSWVDLAMTVGFINSALLAAAVGWALWWWGQPMPRVLSTAGIVLIIAIAIHRGYELIRFRRTFRRIQQQSNTPHRFKVADRE